MHILPTLKEKRRYVLFEVIAEDKVKFSAGEAMEAVADAYRLLFGVVGLAKAGMLMIPEKWSYEKQRGIFRVSHTGADNLKAALASVRAIKGKNVILRSLTTSGTVRKAAQRAKRL